MTPRQIIAARMLVMRGPYTPDRIADEVMAAIEEYGCAVVPKEATEHVQCVGDEAIIESLNEHPIDIHFTKGTPAARCWRAMVAAALEPAP